MITASNSGPYGITNGPDGNIWYTLYGKGQNMIGRITPSGVFQDFPIPLRDPNVEPVDITTGPDGNIWFTESNPHSHTLSLRFRIKFFIK